MSIADKLQTIQNIKENIKTSINNKGGNVGDDFTTYATAIDNIEGGGSITKIDATDYNFRESTFKTLPNIFDFSKKTWFENTFYDCSELQSINIDTSSAFLFRGTFEYCEKLETINELNCENVELFTALFTNCESLTNIGGFKDLGKIYSSTVYLNISASDLITRESMLNVFNSIYDCSNMGYIQRKITISSVVRNKLTESDIAIATNKNWTVEVV